MSAERITPAWAGKSFLYHAKPLVAGDHPRMGGEKLLVLYGTTWGAGSPPHGRGKETMLVNVPGSDWITPAWAGKSCPAFLADAPARDHPRMGGEKQQTVHGS